MYKVLFLAIILTFSGSVISQVSFIKVDQFGYKPISKKVAILSNPTIGYNSADSYSPSAAIELRSADDDSVIYSAASVAWNGGATDIISGDKVWRFDFSSIQEPGRYYVHDPIADISSEHFVISEYVYQNVLEVAFKTFYYQRCGAAKLGAHVENGFADDACHVDGLQDLNCRYINDVNNSSLELDLSGGWHDAGDYNKYVNFAWSAMVDLIMAYEYYPNAWTDDMNIPESGNDIPDLLDEIAYEMDWLMKMQQSDGGVLSLVGVQNFASASPPSNDTAQRYYGPKTTAASFSAASMLALASVQFNKITGSTAAQNYAITLRDAAIDAYDWGVNNPGQTYYNEGILAAGEQELGTGYESDMRRLSAAIGLYAASQSTGADASTYKTYVESNYTNAHMMQWSFVYPFETGIQQSLIYYASLDNVASGVATAINDVYRNSIDYAGNNLPAHNNDEGAYLSFVGESDIVWGSNSVTTHMGNMYQAYIHYGMNTSNDSQMNEIIDGYLHYMHGVNPNGMTYLSNMSSYDSEGSINQVYHGWFSHGSSLWDEAGVSTYGPAPGFVSGGPNPGWSLDGCCNSCAGAAEPCTNFSPPNGQPATKSYKDWNTGWPQNSWSISEPAIYYQATYLQLLASRVNNDFETIPTTEISRSLQKLYVTNGESGITLHSPNGSAVQLSINSTGELTLTEKTTYSPQSTKLYDSYFEVADGIYLETATGDTYYLTVDDYGLLTLIEQTPTNPIVRQESGDFTIMDNNKGLLISKSSGDCFSINLRDDQTLEIVAIKCQN